jgi:hypothetical protein
MKRPSSTGCKRRIKSLTGTKRIDGFSRKADVPRYGTRRQLMKSMKYQNRWFHGEKDFTGIIFLYVNLSPEVTPRRIFASRAQKFRATR